MIFRGWIDVQAHFYPPEPEEVREQRLDQMHEACWCTDEVPDWNVGRVLSYMDRAGLQMQMLSNIPKTLSALQASNDYGASVVQAYPHRFGLLVALPTDNAAAALAEIGRADATLQPDGYAVTFDYNGILLSDRCLEPVWEALDARHAVVFCHPNAYAPGVLGRPCVILDVAFETARVTADMLYGGVFRRYPNICFVIAHCGGALPTLSGRLNLLGLAPYVPNPDNMTPAEMKNYLARLYVDTAATMPTALAPALAMTGLSHIVYGSDCGVPCTSKFIMDANIAALIRDAGLSSPCHRASRF